MDAALLFEHVTTGALVRAAAAAQRWPGASRAVRAVTLADGRAESPLETRGRLRVVGSGLPVFQPQVEIRAGRQLLAVVDGWYDDAALAVEFDGQLKCTAPWRDRTPAQVVWDEKRREDELRAGHPVPAPGRRGPGVALGSPAGPAAPALGDPPSGASPATRTHPRRGRTAGIRVTDE
ncbi:hypothetical protein [Modestobacter marinus]|uniref:hypothetical protein n=1 Tax=Modestobacter marinus TaxID=477641 RepID=UPI001C96DC68|nr:hypothetical protein [Modestobacter marinus]